MSFYTSALRLHMEGKQTVFVFLFLFLSLFYLFSIEKECKYFYGSNQYHREPNLNGYMVVLIARMKNIA
jgi:hypothetical protein